MLIWITTSLGDAAVEHGVLRARDAESMLSVDDLQSEMAVERQTLLDAAARQAAEQLAAARQQVAALLAEATQEADRVRRSAYDEGIRQAMADWHARGIDAAVDKQEALRDTHARLAEIVSNAVERIVHSEDRTTLYRRALKNVQSLTRGATRLLLRVHPADHAGAQECVAAIPDMETAGLKIEVVADPALRPGACVFESDVGVLDASIETQLDALRSAMGRAVRRASSDEAPTSGEPPHE